MMRDRGVRDPVDLEHLDQTVASRGWQLIAERLQSMLTRKLEQLATDLDEAGTWKARGQIDALNTALRLPEILKAEFTGNQRT